MMIMREIVLHLLDLAENSVTAGARAITISVCEDLVADRLTARIEDDGRGMDEETVRKVSDPFFTSRTTRKVGLGIPLLKEAAEACNGKMEIWSKPGAGTQIEASFQHSHIDRMRGNLATFFGIDGCPSRDPLDIPLHRPKPGLPGNITNSTTNGQGSSGRSATDPPRRARLLARNAGTRPGHGTKMPDR